MTFSRQLLNWYDVNKRDLPWRRTKDPYLVWLSEVIMQQTRVGQGLPYYEKFALAWPTVADLAAAGEHDVLKMWQGLGYYTRARNLHATARQVVEQFNGAFPGTYEALRALKGVGDYTAAAIASIVFNSPHPVVDGNVIRFITRLYGIREPVSLPSTRRLILGLATQLLDHDRPGDFNQAMMEYGATVCTPANPGCSGCIFSNGCASLSEGIVDIVPVRGAKPAVIHRVIHYLVITEGRISGGDHIYLNRRTGSDIWKNLYDFPQPEGIAGSETDRSLTEQEIRAAIQPGGMAFLGVSRKYVHQLTHQKLQVRFYRFHSEGRAGLPFVAVPLSELAGYPIPRVVDRYLKDYVICG